MSKMPSQTKPSAASCRLLFHQPGDIFMLQIPNYTYNANHIRVYTHGQNVATEHAQKDRTLHEVKTAKRRRFPPGPWVQTWPHCRCVKRRRCPPGPWVQTWPHCRWVKRRRFSPGPWVWTWPHCRCVKRRRCPPGPWVQTWPHCRCVKRRRCPPDHTGGVLDPTH